MHRAALGSQRIRKPGGASPTAAEPWADARRRTAAVAPCCGPQRRSAAGFTLIELLITLVVIAVLAAIAFPAYESYMARGRRSQAEQLMSRIASREEEYMLDAHAYTTTIGTGGLNVTADGWTCATTCTNSYYTVSVATQAGPPPGYTIAGQAQGSQASDGNLALASDGSRSRTAGDGSW